MYDLVINNGTIVDGSGRDKYIGSIGIIGSKIKEISKSSLDGKNIIDAVGLVVSPGFIDLHTHSETGFILDNRLENKVFQGVTTDIVGNCGISLFPRPQNNKFSSEFENYCSSLLIGVDKISHKFNSTQEYSKYLLDNKIAINCGILIGHGTLRICAMGFSDKSPTNDELNYMKELLENELEMGALGMSVGLIYPPGSYSNESELIELAKSLKKYDAILTAHVRNEESRVFDAVQEMINIASETGIRVHLSHLKLMGTAQWGKADDLVSLIENARENGLRISCDQYPYAAASTTLSALVPAWAQEGGTNRMLERLHREPEKILPEIRLLTDKRGGAERVNIAYTFGMKPEYDGKYLSDLSESFSISSEEAVIKILCESQGRVNAIYYSMSEDDVYCILKNKNIAVGSDGFAFDFENKIGGGVPHPRSFGTFPRFIRLCREKQILSIEKAIFKATSLAAKIMNLDNIGEIKEGNKADIIIFDWNEFSDKATFENPFRKPIGLRQVIVSGEIVLKENKVTSNRPGTIISAKMT